MGPGGVSLTTTPTPEGTQAWPPGARVLAPGWLGRMKAKAGGHGDALGDEGEASGRSRTTSSPERRASRRPGLDVDLIAKTIGSMLALVAAAAAWAAHKSGRDLREPEPDERAKVAEPMARILDRHVGSAWLNDDLLDVVEIGAGLSAYAQTRPLQRPAGETPAEPSDDLPEGYEAP